MAQSSNGPQPTNRYVNVLVIIACGLVISAQFVPALASCVAADASWIAGSVVALWGWAAIMCGVFAWYANPLFVICAILLMRGPAPAVWLSALQLILALSALLPMKLPVGIELEPLRVRGYGPGFWLWICGQVTLVGAAAVARFTRA